MPTITDQILINLTTGEYATGSPWDIANHLCEFVVEDRVVSVSHRGRKIMNQGYTEDWKHCEMIRDAAQEAVRRLQTMCGFVRYTR